jgi:DNA-directed RNA polymerase I subunit RPA1
VGQGVPVARFADTAVAGREATEQEEGRGGGATAAASGHGDADDDDDAGGEDDGTAGGRGRRRQQVSYDAPGEDADERQAEGDADAEPDDVGPSGGADGEVAENADDPAAAAATTTVLATAPVTAGGAGLAAVTLAEVVWQKGGRGCTLTVRAPLAPRPLLAAALVEREAMAAVLREVGGIKRCFLDASDADGGSKAAGADKPLRLATEGVNLRGLWAADVADEADARTEAETEGKPLPPPAGPLNLARLGTNDVRAVLETYGVEAARATLVREIGRVFAVYGISVDPRHLGLVADAMVGRRHFGWVFTHTY